MPIQLAGEQQQVSNIPGISPIRGPRGTLAKFKIQASIELQTSTFLFDQLGSTISSGIVNNCTIPVKYID